MTYLITILRRDGSRYKYQAAEVPAELKLGGEVVAYKVARVQVRFYGLTDLNWQGPSPQFQDNNMEGKTIK